MIYIKTSRGKHALTQRTALSLRERQVMVLCNGARMEDDLIELFGDSVRRDIEALKANGYLRPLNTETEAMPLEAFLQMDADMHPAQDQPTTDFMKSRIPEDDGEPRHTPEIVSMSLTDLEQLAQATPPPRPPAALPTADDAATAPAEPVSALPSASQRERARETASLVNSISAEQMTTRSVVAAQAYMTQVLMALDRPEASALIEQHGDVRHEVDVLIYLAQGLGEVYRDAGEDVALRVALRLGRLLPHKSVPMLLDCALDTVPHEFSVLLYEFVLAGRDMDAG